MFMDIWPHTLTIMISSAVSVVTSYVVFHLKFRASRRNDQKKILWEKELDRLLHIQELAGELTESIPNCMPEPEFLPETVKKMCELRDSAGKFRRYPKLNESIKNLYYSLCTVLDQNRKSDIQHEALQKLENDHNALVSACKQIISN